MLITACLAFVAVLFGYGYYVGRIVAQSSCGQSPGRQALISLACFFSAVLFGGSGGSFIELVAPGALLSGPVVGLTAGLVLYIVGVIAGCVVADRIRTAQWS